MKRNDLIVSSFVKRVIVWAMVIMVAVTPAISNMITITAYASEEEADDTNAGENKSGGDDSNAKPESVQKAESTAGSIKAETEKVTGTEESIDDKGNKVEAIEGYVDKMEQSAELAKGTGAVTDEAGNIVIPATGAEAAKQVADIVKVENITGIENVDEASSEDLADGFKVKYETEIDAEQKVIDDATKAVGDLLVTTEGTTESHVEVVVKGETVDLVDYVSEQATVAVESKVTVEKVVEEALAIKDKAEAEEFVNSTETQTTLKNAVSVANMAAHKAQVAYDKANNVLTVAVETYNKYAYLYNEPLYGETEVKYTEEDRKNAMTSLKYSEEELAQMVRVDLATKDTNILAVQEEIINGVVVSVNAAKDEYVQVKAEAETAIQKANTLLGKDKEEGLYTDVEKAAAEGAMSTTEADEMKSQAESQIKSAQDELTDIVTKAETTFEQAETTVQKAQEDYNKAKEQLKGMKETLANRDLATVNLAELLKNIAAAKADVDKAEEQLVIAKESYNAAIGLKKMVNRLVEDHTSSAFELKPVAGEEGWKLTEIYEYEQVDGEVVSRPKSSFELISNGMKTIDVPYSVYNTYMNFVYNRYKVTGSTKEINGTGIAYNADGEEGATLAPVYWVIDGNGKLTGEYFTDTSQLTDQERYFIAYAFKNEVDGYHFDGYLFTYTAPVIPVNPDEPTTPGEFTTTGGGGTTTTAVTPTVLGATRELTNITEEPAAQAATPEAAVLGADRNPQTGDQTNIWVWLSGMAASVAVLAGWSMKNKKNGKKEA